jgi:phosphate transport system substrate-binding protein
MKTILIKAYSAMALIVTTTTLSAGEVRLNGASTTVNGLINPHKAGVEAATGLTLKIVGSNTGKGIAALVDGQCDVALTSEPLDIALTAAKSAGKDLNAADFQIHSVREDTVVFVVHLSNPVDALTHDQVKAIHLGKITNWKEVGGPDLAILTFTDAVTGGTRALLKKFCLDGEEYAPVCKPLESVRFVATSVSELKAGFGGVGAGFADSTKVKVLKTERVPRPLGFITKGAPSADVQKVIDGFKAEVAKK